jgi:hypothetical protein
LVSQLGPALAVYSYRVIKTNDIPNIRLSFIGLRRDYEMRI